LKLLSVVLLSSDNSLVKLIVVLIVFYKYFENEKLNSMAKEKLPVIF